MPAANVKPAPPVAQPPAFPPALTERAQWLAFKLEPDPAKPDKPKKMPYIGPGQKFSRRLLSYADAVALAASDGFAGVGFRFTASDPLCFVDLDGCRDPATGVIAPWATAIIERLDSYTEISISGKGVHVLAFGKPGAHGKSPDGHVEMYDRGQYAALTGDVLDGRATLQRRDAELGALKAELRIGDPKPETAPLTDAEGAERLPPRNVDLADDQLLQLIAQEHAALFSRLFEGDFPPLPKGVERDASKDDAALIRQLIEYVGWDEARLDTLARRSALKRDKWDEKRKQRFTKEPTTWLGFTIRNLLREAAAKQRAVRADALLTATALLARPDPAWLIESYLPANVESALHGPPESGKSFLALDWALTIAAGLKDWHGHAVATPGRTLVVITEGEDWFKLRVASWCAAHRVKPEDLNTAFLLEPVNLLDATAVEALIAAINGPLTFAVFDTLWRMMPGGSENDTKDMGRIVDAADRLRRATGAHTMFVHHEPRAEPGRLQGSNVLPRAIRTSFRLGVDGPYQMTLSCTKMNDAPRPKPLPLKLTKQDASYVVDADPARQSTGGDDAWTAAQRQALAPLHGGMKWTAWLRATGMSRSTFDNVVKGLKARDLVRFNEEMATYERNEFALAQGGWKAEWDAPVT